MTFRCTCLVCGVEWDGDFGPDGHRWGEPCPATGLIAASAVQTLAPPSRPRLRLIQGGLR